ncbi:phosphoglycerate dehydrogenase [Aureococcus anophagefferens]|uniref:Phosphoglycerate dehydrogenase n=1 Tax=Aureococcus anophagefferens TaxID=44056 RepID=A0ABR1FMS2_AURAN
MTARTAFRMPLRWLLLAASARCRRAARAPPASRPCTALNAKVVVADGFTATANAGFGRARATRGCRAVGDGDELEVHDRTAPGDVVAVLDGAAVAVVNKVRITDAVLARVRTWGSSAWRRASTTWTSMPARGAACS